MDPLILAPAAMSIVSTAGTQFAIKTLTATSSSVCNLIGYFTNYDVVYLNDVVEELNEIDLPFTVAVIGKLVMEYKGDDLAPPVEQALIGVNRILEAIHDELQLIDEAIKVHNKKYFSSYRGFNCDCNIATIKKHKKILDGRYRILMDLLKFNL